MKSFDFLVIGGGIAGLSFALEVAKHGTVAVLFKGKLHDSSTSWAQGGIAAVSALDDDPELHYQDTLKAGCYLNDPKIVKLVVEEGPNRVEELIQRGIRFDKDSLGYHLHMEGGHSRRRIFHFQDSTGFEIQSGLLKACQSEKNIQFFTSVCAIDLLTSAKLNLTGKNKVLGVYVLNPEGKVELMLSNRILVATGGAGKVYLYTSNPDVATGDGIAICQRAGVPSKDMEFFQFHPTCLFHPAAKTFLISEALRGEGAKLKRINGEEFMLRYDSQAELAPRDIVARAIDSEMKLYGEEHVLLDISHRDPDFIKQHFPAIYQKCLEFGIDITSAAIPVVPAAHYLCGGVEVDQNAATSIDGLYAAGEVACSGLHGANRLASNSLLEGLVFAYRAAEHALDYQVIEQKIKYPDWDPGTARNSDEEVVIAQNWDEIRRLMWNYVGIVRSDKRLLRALRRIELIKEEVNEYYWNFLLTKDLIELRNICLVAEQIIKQAQVRKNNLGLHYNLDNKS